jgi:hypothetical protein
MSRRTTYIQRISELLFAIYSSRLLMVRDPMFYWSYREFDLVHLRHSNGHWALVAGLIFGLIVGLGRLEALRQPLRIFLPCVLVLGPLISPQFPGPRLIGYYYQNATELDLAQPVRWLEVGVVLAWVFCYLYSRLGARSIWTLAFPLAHYALWGAILFGPNFRELELFAFVIAPALSLFGWAICVRQADLPHHMDHTRLPPGLSGGHDYMSETLRGDLHE